MRKLEAAADKLGESALTPTLQETVEFGHSDAPVPGLSTAALLEAVFALPEGEEFPSAPVRLGREWLIFRLIDRQIPDEEAFTNAVRESTREVLLTFKKKEAVDLYIQRLRAKAIDDKALRINRLSTQDGRS